MALPARQVLNMVYHDLITGLQGEEHEEDREVIQGWCICTVEEAVEWERNHGSVESTIELLRMAGGEVV